MIVNKQSLLALAPIKDMYQSKLVHHESGTTFGLSGNGYDIRLRQSILIQPKQFVLGSSIEEFQMPANLLGVVHDKSSNIRQGISVFNSVIDSGWNGFLTLEIYNHSNAAIQLMVGMGIAHILFHEVVHPTIYEGAYQNQPDRPVAGKDSM